MSLSHSYLREVQARLDATSSSGWQSFVEGRDHLSGSNFVMTHIDGVRGPDIELIGATAADQDFIAHARQDVQILLDEVLRLTALHE